MFLFRAFCTCVQLSVLALVLRLMNHPREVSGQSSDICDWVGSGLTNASPRGVRPLYLRCSQGHIRWYYPRGSIRPLIRPAALPAAAHFEACIRVAANTTGARLYLEGEGKLLPFFRPGDRTLRRCFASRRGRLALYVEADPATDPLRRHVVEFSYDLVPRLNLADDMEECRPCTDGEIFMSICMSDFVIQGTVASLTSNADLDTSELSIFASKVFRNNLQSQWANNKYITLHRPLKCGTKSGRGEFLYMGRWRLGLPLIHCAPRFTNWKRILQRVLETNSNECQLD